MRTLTSTPVTRRRLAGLVLLPWLGAAAHAQSAVPALLRAGGCAVLLRHGQTDPGIGDPPGFRLGDCASQRNLSQAGREQSTRIGGWFRARRLVPTAVRSSAWCRCIDTAELAFGRHALWSPLSSTFDDRALEPAAADAMRAALASIPAGRFEVWVTHQVNITALTGEFASMGEAAVVDAKAIVQGRTRFTGD
ncbi:MAG: histidine phosphatase family protein [Comamonadaceae bacterium]|nr:MAG: histidine phosphatase family protein [Comamonadaceae bacterium]